jgi:tetratricopeptide (TPR) repeat protein
VAAATSDDGSSNGFGERVRALRRSAGLTQSELASGRFSKEYLSQIERGKTVPSSATVEWLAQLLGTDAAFLESGVSDEDGDRVQSALVAAAGLLEEHRHAEAAAGFSAVRTGLSGIHMPNLVLRALRGEAWARIREGELDQARSLLEQAAVVASDPGLSDVDRAEVEFLVGVCRYTASDIDDAITQLGSALELAEQSGLPCDRLRSDIFHWRSRCWRRLRDWAAAREDIDRALELADARSDPRQVADAYFQASLVAQREGGWVLARRDAERSKELFDQLGDRATVGRLLNNLAGINHLLGNAQRAIEQLTEAFGIFVDLGLTQEAGYVFSSLADVHLSIGDAAAAETNARKALELLGDRVDHLQEIGASRLVLGRSLLAQGRLIEAGHELTAAASIFTDAKSVSHQADGWIAQGDLAQESGDVHEAARLFRQATQALLATHS